MGFAPAEKVRLQVTMKKAALRTLPNKEQIYSIFSRLYKQWPEDPLRPNRSIRALKPLDPENPKFDERHYYYQSAAMKILLSDKIRSHYKLSDEYMNPQSYPPYYKVFRERLDRNGLPQERGGLIKRFWAYITGKENSVN